MFRESPSLAVSSLEGLSGSSTVTLSSSSRVTRSSFLRLRFSGWSHSVVEFGSWKEEPPDDPWEEPGDPLDSRS